jgi:heme/copper-type cytochrome/quinol oxidase subunit 3
MEIPFVVHPRKDTGLFNSKIAIWLFLASEVMLFGGFFSAYIFLRLGADYPWPERTLPVLPGLINTFILIGSSVTVVFAWAALKLRNWRQFQVYMGITIACAVIFMVLKGIEYNVKFQHQGVRLHDYTVIEGHLGYELKEGADHHHPKADDYELDHHGKKVEENRIRIEATGITYSTLRFHADWVEEVISQAAHRQSKVVLAQDIKIRATPGKDDEVILAKAGDPLSVDLIQKARKAHLAARAHNSSTRIEDLRKQWSAAKKDNPGKRGWEYASSVNIDTAALEEAKMVLTEIPTLAFRVEPPVRLEFKPRDVREGSAQSRLRDDTVIDGALQASPMVFHNVDAIDFRHLAMKAVEKGVDPMLAIEQSWIMQNSAVVREAWAWHKVNVAELEAKLAKKGVDAKTGKAKFEPTAKERYRIGWKELAEKAEEEGKTKLSGFTKVLEEFKGPNYAARGTETFPELTVPREQIRFASKFAPAWNTYYAIYFTITGLHGLHVIGGALVLAYYLFFGRRMYDENPEWLANRVEVGGLFWHFVDLVWIFAFPIFYLM